MVTDSSPAFVHSWPNLIQMEIIMVTEAEKQQRPKQITYRRLGASDTENNYSFFIA